MKLLTPDPGAHCSMHTAAPAALTPDVHAAQDKPEEENVPAGHGKQAAGSVGSGAWPAGHCKAHCAAPAGLIVNAPTLLHRVHAVAPTTLLYVPAGQGTQVLLRSSFLNVPA